MLATLRTVNPGSDLAATAVNSKISTGLPLGRDGMEELPSRRRHCAAGRGGKSSSYETLPRNARATASARSHSPCPREQVQLCPVPKTTRCLLFASGFSFQAVPRSSGGAGTAFATEKLISGQQDGRCCSSSRRPAPAGTAVPSRMAGAGPSGRATLREGWQPGARGRCQGSHVDSLSGAKGQRQRATVKDS